MVDNMNRAVGTLAPSSSDSLFTMLTLSSLLSAIILIVAGSIVRVTGYGLGCPDWPLCYGRAVPPLDIGAWVEFGHRLMGGFVALQIVAMTWLAWKDHRRHKWIWRPAAITSGLLIVQVVLGGLHVLNELPRWTGLVHTGVAMAIVGFLALLVAVTQPVLVQLMSRIDGSFDIRKMRIWTSLSLISTFVLILSGSLVTRTGASLACPAFPLCGIREIPDHLGSLVTIQMTHRILALAVAITIAYVLYNLIRFDHGDRSLRRLSIILTALFLVQIGLGIGNVLLSLPLWSRILHLGAATSIWALTVILAVIFMQPQIVSEGN